MSITSKPIQTRVKESAVISRARLRKQRGAIERWTAWVVLFVSFLGTVVVFAGGWGPFIASIVARQPSIAAIGGGIGAQALLTYLEWHYYDVRAISWTARIFDAATTALGYGPLCVAWLIAQLTARDIPQPFYVAWALLGLVSYATAWYPESRLVD